MIMQAGWSIHIQYCVGPDISLRSLKFRLARALPSQSRGTASGVEARIRKVAEASVVSEQVFKVMEKTMVIARTAVPVGHFEGCWHS